MRRAHFHGMRCSCYVECVMSSNPEESEGTTGFWNQTGTWNSRISEGGSKQSACKWRLVADSESRLLCTTMISPYFAAFLRL